MRKKNTSGPPSTSPFSGNTKRILRNRKLAPKKKLGQNFLVHEHTAKRIVSLAEINPEETVVEVGVGLGALTSILARRAEKVIGIEADSGIVRMHEEERDLPENVLLLHQDILRVDFHHLSAQAGGRLKIVANLPYSISSPFLFRLYEHADLIEYAVVMLQKEVAQRLVAKPATKEYGVPTVLLSACADMKILMRVGPEEFHPRPKVDSAVVGLRFFPIPEKVAGLGQFDRKQLRRVVNAAFGQRRKTLVNALRGGGAAPDKATLTDAITSCGLSPSVRAERLKTKDFICLSKQLSL